jgi:hypothetical protein
MTRHMPTKIHYLTLYFLVLMAGLYAGLHFLGLLAPVEQKMSTSMFAHYWQMMDGYMGQRMPFFGIMFLALFAVNLFLFKNHWQSGLFRILVLGLIIVLVDMVFTGVEQFPINAYVQSIDTKNISQAQLNTLTEMKIKTEHNFIFRSILAIGLFILLNTTPFLLLRINNSNLSKSTKAA